MSGFGERFRRANYTVPKPLIEIDGKPIIGHVIDMFPGEHDFLFICNNDHLQCAEYRMKEILREHCPTGRIVGIPPHKLGPIHAVRQVEHLIDPARPVVVNYCDFTCYWDWENFKKFVALTGCAGAIPAAVSSLKCNTGLKVHDFPRKDLRRCFKVEAFARAVV